MQPVRSGYYGVFTANMHTDLVESSGSDSIVAEAQRVRSAGDFLTPDAYLAGRSVNNSTFGSLSWSSKYFIVHHHRSHGFTKYPSDGADESRDDYSAKH